MAGENIVTDDAIGSEALPSAHCAFAEERGVAPKLRIMTKRSDFLAANKGLRVARPGFVLLVLLFFP